jgi:hypothetical protein
MRVFSKNLARSPKYLLIMPDTTDILKSFISNRKRNDIVYTGNISSSGRDAIMNIQFSFRNLILLEVRLNLNE